jgi:hypothetical protein
MRSFDDRLIKFDPCDEMLTASGLVHAKGEDIQDASFFESKAKVACPPVSISCLALLLQQPQSLPGFLRLSHCCLRSRSPIEILSFSLDISLLFWDDPKP